MPVLRVRASTRRQRFRLQVQPSVPDLLLRRTGRLLAGWWRELAAVWLLWWADSRAVAGFGGPAGHLAVGGLLAVALLLPRSRRLLAGWLSGGRVRRRWAAACRACDLATVADRTPVVRRVRRVPAGVRLAVRVRPGQQVADLVAAGPSLAACFAARDLRVEADPGHAGRAVVTVVLREPLADLVAPLPLPGGAGGVDLDRLPVGRTEDGGLWLLPLRGSHVLVAGATGSGKGSVLWSVVRALAPAVPAGLVQVWAVDPKGGMELGVGAGLFARFATGAGEVADLLEAAVALLRGRAGRLRGVTRLHTPTFGDPLVVVVVDEVASLTAYLADKDLRKRVDAALGVLLSQGRAVGVVVVGAVQDPRKEVLPLRGLFPVRVALRVAEAGEVDLVLGQGAHARGATAEKVPAGLPGVGFACVDGRPDPVRVRASYVSDGEVRAVAARYGRPGAPGAGDAGVPGRHARGADPDAWDVAAPPSPGGPATPRPALPGVSVGGWVPDTSAFRPPGAAGPLLPEAVAGAGTAGGPEWEAFAAGYRRRHRLDDQGNPLPGPGEPDGGESDGGRGGDAPAGSG